MAYISTILGLTVLTHFCFVYSKPTQPLDARYFSNNNADLASVGLLDKRADCSLNSIYCPAYDTSCPAGTTCCYSNCCSPGYACYTDGYCYPDVVYTYCSTTTSTYTSIVPSVFYSTVYSTSEYTSTSWATTTQIVSAEAVTTTLWVTIANRLKRDQATQTTKLRSAIRSDNVQPTIPPRYEMREISPGHLFRRKLEKLHLLDKRTSYATVTVFYPTTYYSYDYSTSYYTQIVTSGTTTVVSTYTTTVYDGASTTQTVTSTKRADASVPVDVDDKSVTKRPKGLPIGAKVGIAVGSVIIIGLIILAIVLCWRRIHKRKQERLELARQAENDRLRRENEEKMRIAEAVQKRQQEREETARREQDELERVQAEIARQKKLIPDQTPQTQPEDHNSAMKRRQPYDTLLLGTNEIRILVLHPDNFDKPIRCTLERTYIGDDPGRGETASYEALSYVWEQKLDSSYKPEKPLPKLHGTVHIRSYKGLSTVILPVGSNLEMALLHLRNNSNDRAVWTDQLCVDQEHKPEVNVQMELMRSVYKKATRVIAWLGENESGIDALVEMAEMVQGFGAIVPPELAESGQSLLNIDPEADKMIREMGRNLYKEMEPEKDPGRKTIARIVGLPFWTRRWILQEVTLANSLELQMGTKNFTWKDFTVITEMIDTERFHKTDDFHIVMEIDGGNGAEALLNTVRRRIRPMQLLQFQWHLRKEKNALRFRVLDLVQALRNWHCGVPVDRIFAVIGLISDEDLEMNKPAVSQNSIARFLESMTNGPDAMRYPGIRNAYKHLYTNPKIDPVKEFCGMVEVYGRLVESHAITYGSLDGLNSHTGQAFLHMPSWLPNFHVPNRRYSLVDGVPNNPGRWLVYERPIFKATGNTIAKVRRIGDPAPMFLMVHGRIHDAVDRTLEAFECPMGHSVEIVTRNLQEWAARVSSKVDNWGPAVYDGDFEKAVRFTSVAGLTTRRDSEAPNRVTLQELYQDELPQGDGTLHRMSLQYAGPVFRAQCGRRLFRTKMGFIGTGPAEMIETDFICLLDGGQTPYVIRVHPSETWTFIGECYIHEIMDGETLSWPAEMRQAEQDFIFN